MIHYKVPSALLLETGFSMQQSTPGNYRGGNEQL